MLTSLHIEGFRGLESLSIERLARINLIVGMNQSGKTSLLDAIQILLDRGSPRALDACQARRNERFVVRQHDDGSLTVAPRLDTLFNGGKLRPGARFKLSATTPEPQAVEIAVDDSGNSALPRVRRHRPQPSWAEEWSRLVLNVRVNVDESGATLPVPHDEASLRRFRNWGLDDDDLVVANHHPFDFVDVAGLDRSRLVELWSGIALTPREDQLVRTLNLIEPTLEGLRLVQGLWPESLEFRLKLKGLDEPLHLGDMGEGFRRLLGLLLVLPGTPRQELLIDEIDTGLHYSVLPAMWQLVLAEARRRDLQLFATTHSWDCVDALARLAQHDPEIGGDILLHRIDSDHVTSFDAQELDVIREHKIEVRG